MSLAKGRYGSVAALMRRVLTWLLRLVLIFLGMLALALAALVARPSLLLNTKNVSAALRRFAEAYQPRWTDLSVAAENAGLRDIRLRVQADDFCVDQPGRLAACATRLDCDVTLRLGLSLIGSLKRLDHLELRIPRAKLFSSSQTVTARLEAFFSSGERKPLAIDAYIVERASAPPRARSTRARLLLESDLLREGRLSFLELKAGVEAEPGLLLNSRARIEPAGEGLVLKAEAAARLGARLSRARLDAAWNAQHASAEAAAAFEDPGGPLRRAELRSCRLEAPLQNGRPRKAELRCALALGPAPFGMPKGRRPPEITGRLSLDADFFPRGVARDRFKADLKTIIEPQPSFYGFFARLEAKLSGETGRLAKSLESEHQLEAGFDATRFADVVEFFEGTAYAIGAPFNAMRGPLRFRLRSQGRSRTGSQDVEYGLTSDLASARQRLKARVRGNVRIKDLLTPRRRIINETQVDLQDIALELPYLEIGSTPALRRDPRIHAGAPGPAPPPAKSTQSAVAYSVRVLTRRPVRLLSNLVEGSSIPISLDLTAKPAGLSGQIRIESFDTELFRQKGRVDHLTLTPRPGVDAMGLDGRLVYKRQDVTINILLLGSTEKPQVAFQSDPPMDQNEIVSVLLYGKSPAQLSSDEQASAGNAANAFTSGAFGLASLYLFASTPVESVGYDAATQSYEVRFKLPGGASLAVGSDLEESRTLSLRKRVVRNVELEMQLRRDGDDAQQRNVLTTFLQWFRRY